ENLLRVEEKAGDAKYSSRSIDEVAAMICSIISVYRNKEMSPDNESWSVRARNKDVGTSSKNGTHTRDQETKT
ncbi:hypothetical protein S245_051357, partial [Arachis hypogaea]